LGVGGIAVEDFGEVSDDAVVEEPKGTIKVGAGGGSRGIAVYLDERLGIGRELPYPCRAVVVGGFAACVLVAEVVSPVGSGRVVEAVSVMGDGKRVAHGAVGEGANGAGDEEGFAGAKDGVASG